MITTNPRNFRSDLKAYLDQAQHQPIRIIRRSKEGYVLMSDQEFARLQSEISNLQRRLLDTMQTMADAKSV